MNLSILYGFRLAVLEKNLGVYGINVYQEGVGSFTYHFRDNNRVHLFSGSKSFASLGVGLTEAEGRFSLEDKVLSFFKEYKGTTQPGSEKITIRDLLHMSSGHKTIGFTSDASSHEQTKDWASIFFNEPMEHDAGGAFFYENMCTYMLGRIVEAVTGETLKDYLVTRLFKPLEIHNPVWDMCPQGHTLSAVGLYLKTEEFAKLGILMLNNGIWNEKQIVPKDYIYRAVNDIVDTSNNADSETNNGYGYQFWKCTPQNVYRADGKYGQFSIVAPDKRAVITITAHNENNANDILRAVWSEIFPLL